MANTKKYVAAIFCRVDDFHPSLADQIGFCEGFVKSHDNLEFSSLYVVENEKDYWEVWTDLVGRCIAGKYQIVIVQDGNVFTEQEKSLLHDVLIYGVEDLSMSDEPGPEYYKESLAKKISRIDPEIRRQKGDLIREGLWDKMERGVPHSNVPYGYRKDDARMVINPSEAAVVKQIFTWAGNGRKISDIVNDLTKMGIPTPTGNSAWQGSTVSGILTNEAYCGTFVFGKEERNLGKKKAIPEDEQFYIENHHEAIVSKEVFNQVQPARRIRQKAEELEADPLGNKMRCGICGYKLRFLRAGKDKKESSYSCRYHTGTNIKVRELDQKPSIGLEELKRQLTEICNEYIVRLNNALDNIEQPGNESEIHRQKITEFGELLLQNYRAFLDGKIDEEKFWKQREDILNENAQVVIDLREAKYEETLKQVQNSILQKMFEPDRPQVMEEFDLKTVKRLVDVIRLNPDGTIVVSFTLGDLFKNLIGN